MAVRIGAHQAARYLRAEHRVRIHAQVALHDGDVEAGEVEDLGHRLVCQQRLEVGRVVVLAVHLHDMRVPVARAQLHEAELVAHE